MNMRNLLAASLFYGVALTLSAQQSVPPPPKPANDAPANAAVLKLLQVGMPESVVLDKIHAITDKFDTSIDALVVLKQAGATEAELKAIMTQGAAPADQPPAAAPSDNGPTLAETMQFIQEKLKEQGQVAYVETDSIQNRPGVIMSIIVRGADEDVMADPATCALHDAGFSDMSIETSIEGKSVSTEDQHYKVGGTIVFKEVEQITVENIQDFLNRKRAESGHPEITATVAPPVFVVELSALKPVFSIHKSISKGKKAPQVSDTTDKAVNFTFRDEEMADRVAKAILHAVELCGGGNKDKF
jgi:hypothetical protein